MKKILYIALALGAIITTSCKKDAVDTTSAEGAISLSYGIAVDDNTELAYTRAMSNTELLNSAVIEIYQPLYAGLARRYVGQSNIPNPIYLPATNGTSQEDMYRVDVKAGEVVKATPTIASWDQPSYKGSAHFAVAAGNTAATPVKVVAKISNAITKVAFGSGIATGETAFSSYLFTIADEAGNTLEYSSAKNGALGYFIIADDAFEPTLVWSFTGTLNNGEAFEQNGSFIVAQSKQYNINLTYTERNGKLGFSLLVDTSLEDMYNDVIFEPTATGISTTKKSDIWASHTTFNADVDITEYDPEKVYFEYTTSNGGNPDWSAASRVVATGKKNNNNEYEGTFSAKATGLAANTAYSYRLVVTKSATNEEETIDGVSEITTAEAPNVPNASFEEYNTSGNYPVFYATGGSKWWDSGNAGSGDYGFVICDVDTSDKKDGNASARLQSANVVNIKFAAGNLFTGEFAGVIGTKGGKVNFGRPFKGRPSKIRFWVKYNTSTMNRIDKSPSGVTLSTKDYDIAQIKVALGTWSSSKYGGSNDSPVQVNTTDESTFVNFNTDLSTIAYGDFQIKGAASAANYTAYINGVEKAPEDWTQWHQVEFDLVYRDLNTIPTHIIISCAASKYGDYFSGCDSSKMWIDGIELVYDSNIVTK